MKTTVVALALILAGTAAAQTGTQQQPTPVKAASGVSIAAVWPIGQASNVQQPCVSTAAAAAANIAGDPQSVTNHQMRQKEPANIRPDDARKSPWEEPRDWSYIVNTGS